MEADRIICADAIEGLRTLPDESVSCCVTSPPYWKLRDYKVEGQLGCEATPEEYTDNLVAAFREVKRVLRADGVAWLNLGDCFVGGNHGGSKKQALHGADCQCIRCLSTDIGRPARQGKEGGLAAKNLVGIPWRVALALQADGWWLRSEIIWCLSGGTWLYVRGQKGDAPMMLKDAARLDPATVRLWDGERWVRVLGWSRSEGRARRVEVVLRSGEHIICTPTHRFPTQRGLVATGELVVGDVMMRVSLPEPDRARDCVIDEDAAWFAGLYVAEGSMSGDTIQIAGHSKERERWERVQRIAVKFGGYATRTVDGNGMAIRMYGKVLRAILSELVTGRTAKNKGFAPVVWRYSNGFVRAMLEGYLAGDGAWEERDRRWRIGFTRNYNLERDLRSACARLGWHLVLKRSSVCYKGRDVRTFRGEIRRERSGHHNEKSSGEVVAIRRSCGCYVYDVGVESRRHLFALASGILTHNSKPNPLPSSVRDRPTMAHEHIFVLTKGADYWWDWLAVKEPSLDTGGNGSFVGRQGGARDTAVSGGSGTAERHPYGRGRNLRSVWFVPTQPFPGQFCVACSEYYPKGWRGLECRVEDEDGKSVKHYICAKCGESKQWLSHFAVMPERIAEPCIKASCPPEICRKCGVPRVRIVRREALGERDDEGRTHSLSEQRLAAPGAPPERGWEVEHHTEGWTDCGCGAGFEAGVVLDCFFGAGTTGVVATKLRRRWIGVELNADYCQMARKRIAGMDRVVDTLFPLETVGDRAKRERGWPTCPECGRPLEMKGTGCACDETGASGEEVEDE